MPFGLPQAAGGWPSPLGGIRGARWARGAGVLGLIIPYCVGYIRRSTSTGGVHFVSSGVIMAGNREGLKVFV